jgi:hypothetical protein
MQIGRLAARLILLFVSYFRSVTSGSPPAQGCCGTPTPNSSHAMDEEKMAEYLKELQVSVLENIFFNSSLKIQGVVSQHFILFITYELGQ